MFIHLGNNFVISTQDIIAVLNIEPPISNDLQDIMEIARNEKKLVTIGEKGKEKAMVVCDDKVYISPISSTTLYKRVRNQYKEV